VITTVVVLAVAIFAFVFLTEGNKGISVPDVAGDTLSAAKSSLQQQGFAIGAVTRRPSATVQKGHVISTSPAFGSTANKGSRIAIVLSSGQSKVAVPNVGNEPVTQAEAAITKAGLQYKIATDNNAPPGSQPNYVVNQKPAPNVLVKPGDTVTLYVPPTSQPMPNVVNDSRALAKSTLQGAPYYLTVNVATCTGSMVGAVPVGDVCQTSPTAGTTVTPHSSTVTIYVEPPTVTPSPTPSPTPTPTLSPTPSPS